MDIIYIQIKEMRKGHKEINYYYAQHALLFVFVFSCSFNIITTFFLLDDECYNLHSTKCYFLYDFILDYAMMR